MFFFPSFAAPYGRGLLAAFGKPRVQKGRFRVPRAWSLIRLTTLSQRARIQNDNGTHVAPILQGAFLVGTSETRSSHMWCGGLPHVVQAATSLRDFLLSLPARRVLRAGTPGIRNQNCSRRLQSAPKSNAFSPRSEECPLEERTFKFWMVLHVPKQAYRNVSM